MKIKRPEDVKHESFSSFVSARGEEFGFKLTQEVDDNDTWTLISKTGLFGWFRTPVASRNVFLDPNTWRIKAKFVEAIKPMVTAYEAQHKGAEVILVS